MNTSEHIDDLIPSYVLGALTDEEAALVQAHIAVCPSCTRTLGAAKEVVATAQRTGQTHSAGERARSRRRHRDSGGLWDRIRRPHRYEPRWVRTLLYSIPWTAAVVGWVLAVALLAFSHGQSDRLRLTQQTLNAAIDSLNYRLAQASLVRDYLSTPNIQIVKMQPASQISRQASVALVMSPHYATGIIVARGLQVLPRNRLYYVWVRARSGPYVRIGTLTIGGPRQDGVSLVVGPQPLEHYTAVELTEEAARGSNQPTAPIICTAPISPTSTM